MDLFHFCTSSLYYKTFARLIDMQSFVVLCVANCGDLSR